MDTELLTIAETAAWLRVSVKTLREWVRNGRIEAYRVGGRLRFRRSDLEVWLQAGSTLERGDDWGEDESTEVTDSGLPAHYEPPTRCASPLVLDHLDGTIN